jgi:hypothetical protein
VPQQQLAVLKKNIQIRQGLPENFENIQGLPCLFILDDLLNEVFSRAVCDLFTKGSHHRNLSVILITQNLFHQAPHCHDISLSAKYLVALKNVRDRNQFSYLARQVLPEASVSLCEAYLEATQKPHGYKILDFAQDTDNLLWFRTNVFPFEYPPHVYARVNEKRIRSNYHHLQVLKTAKPQLRKAIIKNCNGELVKTISECVLNVLHGNLQLTTCQKKRLRKFKDPLRALADRRVAL